MIEILIPTCKEYSEIEKMIQEIKDSTPENHRIIASCQKTSAAINRNICLEYSTSGILIMLDDDITGFYKNWLTDLIKPIYENNQCIIVSARLKNPDGKTTMGITREKPKEAISIAENNRVATACIVIRRNDVKFDEKFKGSGYEDTQYCNAIRHMFGSGRIYINNNCELIHLNEMKGQRDYGVWKANHAHYMHLNPNDSAVKNQQFWGG